MNFAKRMATVKPSATLKAKLKTEELRTKGIHVINLSAGEPSFHTPQKIKEACKKALDENNTLYGPAEGLPELRQAIVDKMQRDTGLDLSPNAVVVSCGAKQGLFSAIQILIDPGDEVIIPSPYWVTYPAQVQIAEGKPVIVATHPEDAFKLSAAQLEKAVTPKSKMVILNSPSNPTGSCYTGEELKALGGVCAKHNLWVLSDEIYGPLTYDGFQHVPFLKACPDWTEKTVVVNGASKAYAMTGWRMGYIAGPKEFIEKLKTLQGQNITSIPTFVQKACVTAFNECDGEVEEMRGAFQKRRDQIYSWLTAIPKIKCYKPKAAFYMFPDLREYGKPTPELADYLLAEGHVTVIQGESFGAPGFLRISFVEELDVLKEGVERIHKALEKLP